MNNEEMEFQSDGNGAALLLVSRSAGEEYEQLGCTMLGAFHHLGIPYKLRDVDDGCPSAKELSGYACVILGQAHFGKILGQSGAKALKDAVEMGVGLVSFDGDLGGYSAPFAEIFKINIGHAPVSCSGIKTVNTDHYITGTRELDDDLALEKSIEVWPVESPHHGFSKASPLQTPSNWPVVINAVCGKGRAVLFTCPARLWTADVLGHAYGLDDVFWKSIVWAARKPFAIYAMPPFTTAVMDDCSGSYNHFRYVDVMNEHGWLPHLEIYLEDIDRVMHYEDYADSKKLKRLYDGGLAEIGIHGLTYNNLMWFDHHGRKPLSDEALAKNFEIYDACLKKWGIKPSRAENMHFGEIGRNALPYLKARGIEYMSMVLPFDTAWMDVPANKPPLQFPGPYHLRGYYRGYLPEDPHFFIARSCLDQKDFSSTAPAPYVDYLWNNTIFWDESLRTNIERAAQTAVLQVRRGIDARFYGMSVAHEQRVAVISMEEWEQLYAAIDNGLKKYDIIHRSWEYICDYCRSHYDSRIKSVNVNHESGKVSCQMHGKTNLTTALEIYTNNGAGVTCQSRDVPPFTGAASVET
ncbi:MAG: hypothetical protein Q7J98_11995 [Kiritimatiellia bacterium]|nr:hypothetical protein [Kiritimatiellia bacterium]